jgi:hypothetical protein
VRPERVNKWLNSMTDVWWWRSKQRLNSHE